MWNFPALLLCIVSSSVCNRTAESDWNFCHSTSSITLIRFFSYKNNIRLSFYVGACTHHVWGHFWFHDLILSARQTQRVEMDYQWFSSLIPHSIKLHVKPGTAIMLSSPWFGTPHFDVSTLVFWASLGSVFVAWCDHIWTRSRIAKLADISTSLNRELHQQASTHNRYSLISKH